MEPTSLSKDLYSGVILDGSYSNDIDKPSVYLGFEVGEQVATPYQISNAILAWAKQSDRLIVKEYARSHEGRPLYAVFISSPSNLSKLDEIKQNVTLLSDGANTNANNNNDNSPRPCLRACEVLDRFFFLLQDLAAPFLLRTSYSS